MLDRYLTEGGFPDVQYRLNEDRIETDAGPIDVVPACKWFCDRGRSHPAHAGVRVSQD